MIWRAAAAGIVTLALTEAASAGFIDTVDGLGAIHHWRLGEGMGAQTAVDRLGNLHGTYHDVTLGMPGAVTGDPDTSARFYPSYVELPHGPSLLLDQGTIMFWFQDQNSIHDTGLFSKDSSGFDTGGHLTVRTTSSGRVEARLQSTDDSYWLRSDPFIQLDIWHDVAVTFGGAGMILYIDGVEVDTNDYTGGLGESSGGSGNSEPIVLGANSWGSDDGRATPLRGFFSGMMDEVLIFDDQLNGASIAALHTAKGIPAPPALAAFGLAALLRGGRRRRVES